MATPKWFDESTYFANKANQLKAVNPAKYGLWNGSTVRDYFLKNGIDAYTHFNENGNAENVSPNSMFNPQQYLQYKADQLNGIQYEGRDNWTVAEVQQVFDAAGLTAWDHYLAYGSAEGVNPSSDFNVAAYYEAKATQLNKVKQDGRTDWTADDVKAALAEAGLTAMEHYYAYGMSEGVKVTKADAPDADGSYNVYLKATTVTKAGDFAGTANADKVLASGLTSLDFDGQAGNDMLFISGTTNSFDGGTVDGGEGEDAIVLQDKGTSLDMSKADVLNFEKLDLSATGKQTVTMTADQFAAFGNGTAIAVSGVEDVVKLNVAPEKGGLVDATAFQGSLAVDNVAGLNVKVTTSQLTNLETTSGSNKIAIDMATNSALNSVTPTNMGKVSDIILTGSQMDISKVTAINTKDLHFADNAIQDITMTWTQLGRLAEFSDDSNNFALTAEDVLNVKIAATDVASMGTAPTNGKGSLVDSLKIADSSAVDLSTVTWLTNKNEFSGFVDLGSAKASVTVSLDQYGLLQNASSTDKVNVKMPTSSLAGNATLALSDAQDTLTVENTKLAAYTLRVENFSAGKKGDKLSFSAADTGLKESMDKVVTKFSIDGSQNITVADNSILLLREGDVDLSNITFSASAANMAGVAIMSDTGISFYTVAASASALSSAKEIKIVLAGVDITDFVGDNLQITA